MRILGVAFEEDGVSIGYLLPEDLRDKGLVTGVRTVNIMRGGRYASVLAELEEEVQGYVEDILEMAATAPEYEEEDEDDDDAMMGSG